MLFKAMDTTGESNANTNTLPARRRPSRAWLLLLTLPYLGLCFPGMYARATPALLGFPFFYWYQFVWVIVTSCLLGLFYLKSHPHE
jgi:hypothetical protein